MALRLTNYFVHPSDNRYLVFLFKQEIHAAHFVEQLENEDIKYERHLDDNNDILFGVHKRYQKQALKMNFLTHGEFRRPLINNKVLKYALLIFTFGIVAFAIYGSFVSK